MEGSKRPLTITPSPRYENEFPAGITTKGVHWSVNIQMCGPARLSEAFSFYFLSKFSVFNLDSLDVPVNPRSRPKTDQIYKFRGLVWRHSDESTASLGIRQFCWSVTTRGPPGLRFPALPIP